jgi:hypothetical protein
MVGSPASHADGLQHELGYATSDRTVPAVRRFTLSWRA